MNHSADGGFFVTKAETLNSLSTITTWFRIPSSFVFLASEWHADRNATFATICHYFHPLTGLAVRSSAVEEDHANSSMAGRYTSYLNLPATFHELERAIDKIISEYSSNPLNQFLIQGMVDNISCSGVTMTCDVDEGWSTIFKHLNTLPNKIQKSTDVTSLLQPLPQQQVEIACYPTDGKWCEADTQKD